MSGFKSFDRIRHRHRQIRRDNRAGRVEPLVKTIGIRVGTAAMMNNEFTLEKTRTDTDAIFLGFGLSGVMH